MSISSFVTNRTSAVLRGAVALVLGLILAVWPDFVSKSIIYILGGCLILSGIVAAIVSYRQFRREKGTGRSASYISFMGGGNLVFGLLLILFPTFFLDVLMYLLAALVLVFAVVQLLSVYYTSKVAKVNPLLYVVPALLIICSLVVFFDPFESLNAIMIFCGIVIMVYAVSELAEAWVFRNVTFEDRYGQKHEIEDVPFEETK